MSYIANLVPMARRPVYYPGAARTFRVEFAAQLRPPTSQQGCAPRFIDEKGGLELGLLTDLRGGGTSFIEAEMTGYARQPLGPVRWRSLGLAENVRPVTFECDVLNTSQKVAWLGLFDGPRLLLVGDLRQVGALDGRAPSASFASGGVVLLP